MKNKSLKAVLSAVLAAAMAAGPSVSAYAEGQNGWVEEQGQQYWYEDGVKQGTEGRGKEIYDPGSGAWYWLDAVDGGRKAAGKDVYQESEAGQWAEHEDGTGKWVRYDGAGHMIKGWDVNGNGTYYFDPIYGTMAKGWVEIEGNTYYFDRETGIQARGNLIIDGIPCCFNIGTGRAVHKAWISLDGNEYWYEYGRRQGLEGRGKEIYDEGSDAWYWLDSIDQGRKAVSKDVYQESEAGQWAEHGDGTGKWVRYDAEGHMVKGWSENSKGRYYFDPIYGTMAKGNVIINGAAYRFDMDSGILLDGGTESGTPTPDPTTAPTAAPTTAPTAAPTTAPTAAPTTEPTPTPIPLSVNAEEVTLYGMDQWAEEYLSIPDDLSESFQLIASGPSNLTYRVIRGESVDVSGDGRITPKYKITYWYDKGGFSVGYSRPLDGEEPSSVTKEITYGEFTVRVAAGKQHVDIKAAVLDYAPIYAEQVIDQYIAENITLSMTAHEKIEQACRFAAGYDYSASHSGAVSMIICGGGDCWASTDAILRICEKAGLKAWVRNGNRDSGAGRGHKNAMIEADGVYYEADAGYNETAPRYYSIKERDSLYSYRYSGSYSGIELYQYDGPEEIAVHEIPDKIGGQKVVGIGKDFLSMDKTVTTVKLPPKLRYIGDSAFNTCTQLQNIEIPATVKTIGKRVFTQCPKLTSLTCSPDNPYFEASGGCLYNKGRTVLLYAPAVETLVVPDTVETIGTYAFYYNPNLISVTMPESVAVLEEGVFGHSNNLEEVVFEGNGLTTLGDFAFAECFSLEKIVLPESLTSISDTAFYRCPDFMTIYVPKGSYVEACVRKMGYNVVAR